jgi:hypothetical protein
MGLSLANGLAAITPALPLKALVLPAVMNGRQSNLVTCSVQPNPIRVDGLVRFGLPIAARVSLAVYDVQGRLVANPLSDQPEEAGEHEVAVHALGWPAGCYMSRLQAGSVILTRKMIVVR